MFWACSTAQHSNYCSNGMEFYKCLGSKNCVPSKNVNFNVNKIDKKLNFNSGFYHFVLQVFFSSFMCREVMLYRMEVMELLVWQ